MNKNVILLLFTLLFSLPIRAEVKSDSTSIKILLTGASFAEKSNSWFEMGCEQLGAIPLNRAKGGRPLLIPPTECTRVFCIQKKNWRR